MHSENGMLKRRQAHPALHAPADWPRITVITPSYNGRRFIAETLESVLGQAYPNLEVMVMDGGSTDGTVDVLRSYGDRIHWVSEADRGQSHAINKGMALATGEILTFLNADDLYEAGALHAVGRFFAGHPEAAWVTGKCRRVDAEGRETQRLFTWYKNFWLRTHSYGVLQVTNYVPQPATFWRREVADAVGPFREDLYFTMDYDYWLRIGQQFRLYVIDQYLASFRAHLQAKTGIMKSAQFAEDLATAERHVPSALRCKLHAWHNLAIVSAYHTQWNPDAD
jgi:glycosyltransferase involved in cell wall biosynthesis